MSHSLVVFGTRQFAEVLTWYIERESDLRVRAFTVDGSFVEEPVFLGRPVVPYEEIVKEFPPAENRMFVAISYSKMNKLRTEKFNALKCDGYSFISHVSPKSSVSSGVNVGENSFIMEHNVIQPFASIGDNSILWSGNHIGHHARIGNNCFVSSHCVISGSVSVEDNCFIGVNATVRDNVTIASRCLIGAGALILHSTLPDQVFMADPTSASRVPSFRVKI